MCGVYGMVSLTDAPLRHPDRLPVMGARVRHRGPDASHHRVDTHAALGVERLRIVDPRPAADQPFTDPAETRWLAANAMVYNADDLRGRYPGFPFRSRSDVESLLPHLAARGPAAFDDVIGMFAVAVWEPQPRVLTLARDRAGEKPLFYRVVDGELWFASEIQALLVHPTAPRRIDRRALDDYLAYGFVREPRTMFAGVRKVPAGTVLRFAGGTRTTRPIAWPTPAPDRAQPARRVEAMLSRAVTQHLRADVPVGLFLSGGLDSSLLTALATRATRRPIHTFAARFDDPAYDEGPAARAVAAHLGTVHHETTIDLDRLLETYQTVVKTQAEPLADPAVLPTRLLAADARQTIGVALSGEGADELFGGYPTYAGHWLAEALPAISPRWSLGVAAAVGRLGHRRPVPVGPMIARFARYRDLPWAVRHVAWFGTGLWPWLDRAGRDRVAADLPGPSDDVPRGARALDYRTYLREGLLTKLDRATMAVGLETRCPYLDPALTRYALGLPSSALHRGTGTKRVLRRVAAGYLPRWVLRRTKRGFSVPVHRLLGEGLRTHLEGVLVPDRLAAWGLRDLPIAALLTEHRMGRRDHARALWALVILGDWLDSWGGD